MEVRKTDKFEIHYIFDIPSVVLSTIKVLLNREDKKAYIVIFGNPTNLPKLPTEIAQCIE